MTGVSPLGTFIFWMHDRASERAENITATELIAALRYGHQVPDPIEARIAGLELRDGRPHSDLARKVQRGAMARLHDRRLALDYVDAQGYTPVNVRSFLSVHWGDLEDAELGSDENCVCIDLTSAIARAGDMTRTVAELLIAGLGPQEIGATLKTNGSRRINRAMAELSRILEGRYAGAETTGRCGCRGEAGVGADNHV
jgi:hypothetical protein